MAETQSTTAPMDLSKLTGEELQDFLDSFDVVFSDCDGVLWIFGRLISGAMETLKKFQDLGKMVYLVSNNSTAYFEDYEEMIRPTGFRLRPELMLTPSRVVAWYLKKIDFRGEAYVIGSNPFRKILAEQGIKMSPKDYPVSVDGDWGKTMEAVLEKKSYDAIIIDFDLNANWTKLAFAINCLKRDKNLLYLAGTNTDWIAGGYRNKALGPGPLIEVVSKHSSRVPIDCAKPSKVLKQRILELPGVNDPKRCLFIGDSISTDMVFATECGFRKLFVDSGVDGIEAAMQNEKTRPDYYISRLGSLLPLIESWLQNKMK